MLEECRQDYQDPRTQHYDPEQDKVFAVNIGLSNLEYLGLQDNMGKLLVEKKKLDARRKKATSEKEKESLKKRIEKT